MINLQSIISLFDDKPTLLKWLKKVEAALAASVLTSVGVNQVGEDVTLTFNFEDGTNIVATAFKFNKQITAANIENGHLIFTFADGSTEDAGNLFNGDVTLEGNIAAVGVQATGTGVKTSVIQQNDESGIDVFASEVNFNNDVSAGGTIASESVIKTPALTSDENEISAQKPVVEVMTGYSFTKSSLEAWTPIYVSVCKNANKITFVVVGSVAKTENTPSQVNLGQFTIPNVIGAKLFPFAGSTLDKRNVSFSNQSNNNIIEVSMRTIKNSNVDIRPVISVTSGLTNNQTYYFRYEATFLLSENLAA